MGTTTLLTLYRLNFIPSSTACLCSVSQEHFTSFFNIPEIAMLDRKNSLNKGRSLRCWRSLTKLTKCYQRNAGSYVRQFTPLRKSCLLAFGCLMVLAK